MGIEKIKSIVAAPSYLLMLEWLINGELWRFGVGEDPEWGKRPIDQIAIKSMIHELANKITDKTIKEQVESIVSAGIVNVAKKMANSTK